MWSTKYLSPQTEEDSELFPPYLKRSKEVKRHVEETVLPVPPQYAETFCRPDVQLPCEESFRFEPFLDPGLHSTSPAGMVSRHNRASVGLTHKKLPHPSQLMGGKKRRQGLQKVDANVLKHLGELRMKQRLINALKGDKWLGVTAVSSPEESRSPTEAGNEELLGRTDGDSFSNLMDNPDMTRTKPHEAASSLTHQFLFRGNEQFLDLAPGGNPMMAFVAGTAHRSLLMFDDACATVNPAGSDVFPRSVEEEMLLLRNLKFF
ncbi:uncharacterized protein LOC125267799 isoform X2 [Megalobrama amblycephala]|uniref:uncharacterized protein LOC125267799 isoform X2 n=1 Tax=Megalobrama amblycephala TaxID=75352 RepID=UPI002014813D|nr:uncharacterized protein LOC125267799 isoform X2 [Megalobrama amblycephala]